MTEPLDVRYFPLILDVLDQGVFTVDENALITWFNREAERITGYSASEVIGKRCSEVFRTNLCNQVCPLRMSIASRRPFRNREVYIRVRDGKPVPISVSTAPLVTRGGRLLGGVEVFRDLSGITVLKRRLDGRYRLEDFIGKSLATRQILDLLPLVAASDSTVLVTGASGTGKELVARTIHSLGPRKRGPFVAVNCAALPDTLVESELFGYKRGAFTGARQDKPGRIAAANGGTLFLDEVGDLPLSTQVKVLRFLQDKVYEPLGSNASSPADVRILAATNRNLQAMVRRREFREDLYFRLNVVQVDIPPLASRPEDIPLLVGHFVDLFRQSTGKLIEGVSEAAMAALMAYSYPGNVRELENIIERAFVLCQRGRIRQEHLPPGLLDPRPEPAAASSSSTSTLDEAERQAIAGALARHNGNRTHAAGDLGIHRTTLVRKLKQFGMV